MKKVNKNLVLVGVVILFGSILGIGILSRTKTITIFQDGKPQVLMTSAWWVNTALEDANIQLQDRDSINPPVNSWLEDGDEIYIQRAVLVSIYFDGEFFYGSRFNKVPQEILDTFDIKIAEEQNILVSGNIVSKVDALVGFPYIQMEIRSPKELLFNEGNDSRKLFSLHLSLAETLFYEGVDLFYSDFMDPDPETMVEDGISINLDSSERIKIEADGVLILSLTKSNTVGEALAEVGLSLQGLDYSIPKSDQKLPDNGEIRIIRVVEEVVLEQQPLAFTTLLQPVADLEIDNLNIVQVGEFGLEAQRIRIRYENGEEVSRAVEDEWVAREPKPRIEGYGTNIVVRNLETADGTIQYWRAVEVYATSYSPARAGTPTDAPNYGITYSGEVLTKGHIAVLRNWYPSMGGRNFYVPGYGFGVVADIGGGIADRHWIDLGFEDDNYEQWNNWTTFYFLLPVPPADQILWILP